MAKEMIIVFVYDTQLVQNEEDDPASAILYFHPTWVSDQQKTALCGQLMGVFHCLKNILKCPRIISLQSGKFFIKEYGRYLLATGTDRNIVDWLLEHRANILDSLITFYHKDIKELSIAYQTPQNLSAKLYHMFETYLKVLFLGGNIFIHIPNLKLPKSASNVFLEAIHILQSCQNNKNVLGGTLLYHNKVVATQLNSDYTKRIVLTDPYRIKSPAEMVTTSFKLPLGVQLYEVYIDNEEYYRLQEDAIRCRNIPQYLSETSITKPSKPAPSKEPVISAMKRDQSLLFTAVPEEDADHSADVAEPIIPMKNVNRPKFLNLRSKTTDATTEIKESSKSIVNTPLIPPASVCSTPLSELNKVVHSTPLSICANWSILSKEENKSDNDAEAVHADVNLSTAEGKEKPHTSLHSNDIIKLVPFLQVKNSIYDKKKYYSMNDLHGISKTNDEKCIEGSGDEIKSEDDEHRTPVADKYKTITDPLYPIFKTNGYSASYSYYKEAIMEHAEMVKKDIDSQEQNNNSPSKAVKLPTPKVQEKLNSITNSMTSDKETTPTANNPSQDRRKSLSLPLKSLGTEAHSSTDQVTPINRRYSMGVQLTPLMSKLSALEFEDRSSGFGSRQSTPGDPGPFTPGHSFPSFKYKTTENKAKRDKNELQKCIMFVFGQQDTVVVILLQQDACNDEEVFSSLFDTCSECLSKLEKQMCHCLETYPQTNFQTESEPYSFLCLDPDWDTVQRGGPWTATELGALTHLHRDFMKNSNLIEILVRGNENVIYGYHLGDTEVFYHEAASSVAGMPTPADTMGNVPLKARRRLERDHSVILL